MPYAVTVLTRYARSWSIAAVLLALGSAPSAAAPPQKLEARFEVFGFAGIHLLTNRTTVEEAAHQYGITMNLDTRGLARVFVDLTSHSDVRGDLDGDTAHPQLYRSDVSRNGVGRHYRVDYGEDGTVVDASTRPSSGSPLPVTKEQIRSTVDQLTAYFLLERQLSDRGTCAMVVRVFDGSGLYNLRFTNFKRETLTADGYQNFAGPAQSCEVVRQDLVTNPDGSERTYQRGRIWYARVVPGDDVMPVRMEYDTALGVVKGYLAEVRGTGIDLYLMRE
ncbi:MAG: DUF3108 domain-containing protein [Stellaceae bacterium]